MMKSLTACLALALALSACDKNPKTPPSAPSEPAPPAVTPPVAGGEAPAPTLPPPVEPQGPVLSVPAEVVEKAKLEEEAMMQRVGQACFNDTMCPRYLRCQQSKCAIPRAMTGEGAQGAPKVTFMLGDGLEASFALELAISAQEQQRGLMYRRSMKPDWGMLFIYPSDGQRSFWMKNTLLPLDMVFINSKGVVTNVRSNVPPLTLEPRTSTAPARYVLELGAGVANKSGITAGQRVRLENLKDEYKVRP